MKTVKTVTFLTLATLMGIAGQVTAIETQPFYGYGTESYTTGGANVPSQPVPTSAPLPDIFQTTTPSEAFGTTTPATNLVGTEGTENGSTVATEAIKIGQSYLYIPAEYISIVDLINAAKENGNTVNQTIDLLETTFANSLAAALNTTNLDTLTKSEIQLEINNQAPIIKNNLKKAYAELIADHANDLARLILEFNNVTTTEEKTAFAQALFNARIFTNNLNISFDHVISILINNISDITVYSEVMNQLKNDKQLVDLVNTLKTKTLPAAINTQIQQTVGSDMQTIANSFLSYIPNTTNTVKDLVENYNKEKKRLRQRRKLNTVSAN